MDVVARETIEIAEEQLTTVSASLSRRPTVPEAAAAPAAANDRIHKPISSDTARAFCPVPGCTKEFPPRELAPHYKDHKQKGEDMLENAQLLEPNNFVYRWYQYTIQKNCYVCKYCVSNIPNYKPGIYAHGPRIFVTQREAEEHVLRCKYNPEAAAALRQNITAARAASQINVQTTTAAAPALLSRKRTLEEANQPVQYIAAGAAASSASSQTFNDDDYDDDVIAQAKKRCKLTWESNLDQLLHVIDTQRIEKMSILEKENEELKMTVRTIRGSEEELREKNLELEKENADYKKKFDILKQIFHQ